MDGVQHRVADAAGRGCAGGEGRATSLPRATSRRARTVTGATCPGIGEVAMRMRAAQALETRRRIVASARELLVEKGYAATTAKARRLCARNSISAGSSQCSLTG